MPSLTELQVVSNSPRTGGPRANTAIVMTAAIANTISPYSTEDAPASLWHARSRARVPITAPPPPAAAPESAACPLMVTDHPPAVVSPLRATWAGRTVDHGHPGVDL